MATRRMIASDIWRDDFVGELPLFERLLWVGLIVTCADDQGRILNNPRLIRSDVFPLDDFAIEHVEVAIQKFSEAGKVLLYTAEGKNLIQIINWWEYQTPSWASASKYPAPGNWVDRVKCHTAGNKIVVKDWDKTGGFIKLPSGLPSGQGSGLNEGDVKGDDDDKGEGEEEAPPAFLKPEIALIREVTGLIPDITNQNKVINHVQACRKRLNYPPREVLAAELKSIWDGWCATKTKDGRPYNPANWDWTERAATGYNPLPINGSGKKVRILTGANGEKVEEKE